MEIAGKMDWHVGFIVALFFNYSFIISHAGSPMNMFTCQQTHTALNIMSAYRLEVD